jgi:ABC-2 type transport system ATP-binding protein
MHSVEIDKLSKSFGPIDAVRGVTFTVGRGEVLGFLGPNGAGKSTTMKMLAGFLTPTSGTARICGHDVITDGLAARRRLGYLPEGAPSYPDMTPGDFLTFIARIRGFSGAEARRAVDEAVTRVDIGDVLQQPIDTLSKGFKRRVGLAQALLHDPDVLVLDEPTDGLDPNQKHHVRSLIASMAASKAIIISTHILEEVDAVCTRAMVIANGTVLVDGTPAELEQRSPYHHAVYVRPEQPFAPGVRDALAALPDVAAVHEAGRADPDALYVLPAQGHDVAEQVRRLLHDRGISAAEIRVERGRLDDVFRDITQKAA